MMAHWPAFKTETVTKEVFNDDVVAMGVDCIVLRFSEGTCIPISNVYTLDQQASLLRDWLKDHVIADRKNRKDA